MRNSFCDIPRGVLMVCVLAVFLSACSDGHEPKPVEKAGTELRVVMAGHLYSLYAQNRSERGNLGIFTREWLELFASEVAARDADALFLLGDTTRFSTEEEWTCVNSVLEGLTMPSYRIAGNHDLRDSEMFKKHKGLGNASFVIKNCKFIALDNKCVLEPGDLAFLDSELEGGEKYDHIFIVMHYCMINWNEAHPGQDPREPYPGVSNWNRDVVPRIAGKVNYVFCGDHAPGGPTRYEQEHDGKTIHYVMNSFVFRRGETDEINGEGMNVYLELVVDGDEVQILPRALPIPVNDAWYRNHNVEETWKLFAVQGAWAWAPPDWQLKSNSGQDVLRFQDKAGTTEIFGRREKLKAASSLDAWRTARTAAIFSQHPKAKLLTGGDFLIWHQPAHWDLVQLDPADQSTRRFFCTFEYQKDVWSFEGQGPATEQGVPTTSWLSQMIRLVGGMKQRGK